jgi:hypothetical protein
MPDMTKFVWKLSAYVVGLLTLLALLDGAYAGVAAAIGVVGVVPVLVIAALIVGGMVTAAFIHSRSTAPATPGPQVGASSQAAVGGGAEHPSSESWTNPG